MRMWVHLCRMLWIVSLALTPLMAGGSASQPEPGGDKAKKHGDDHGHGSRLTEEVIPLQVEAVPTRPKPLLELGEPFLGTGTLSPGIRLPTGAVWQPSLLLFATFRTAVQSNGYDPVFGDSRTTEAAARLDLFANLQLSGTERLVVGFRNLDQDGRFTGYVFDSDNPAIEEGYRDEYNGEVGSLFFEGDIGEIFPNLSPRDFKPTDVGFSVGRQPMFFQEGMLINDTIDGIGLTWNSLQPTNTSNFRATFFYGWNEVNRGNDPRDSGQMAAFLTSTDFPKTTLDVDVAYVRGQDSFDDLVALGISAVQRLGRFNTAFRVLGSFAEEEAGGDGTLVFSEVSWTPHHTHNLAYFTTYAAFDRFTPAASGPANGGPLGRAGINFAATGLGNYGAPLSSQARDVAGGALGYQMFFNHTRSQVIVELGARLGLEDVVADQYATTARYQVALGRRFVIVIDGFANHTSTFDDDTYFGGRLEFQVRL